MAVDKKRFITILKSKDLKVTKQRVVILEVLSSCRDKHLSVEEIYELVKVDCPEIGLATVYRTIQLLLELNLVDQINLNDGLVRYEMGDVETNQSKHHHHHLICLKCGQVRSFEEDFLEKLERHIEETTGFLIRDHEVKLYGYCKECGGKLIETKKE